MKLQTQAMKQPLADQLWQDAAYSGPKDGLTCPDSRPADLISMPYMLITHILIESVIKTCVM